MKKLISILTATAAGFIAVGSANAADLPSKKAAPAQYVKICDAFGAGFFYIPGSDTCLKIGGQVRAEFTERFGASTSPKDPAGAFGQNTAGSVYERDAFSFRSRAYIQLDARTKTSYGDLRSYINLRITGDSTVAGPFGGGKNAAGQSTGQFQGYALGQSQIWLQNAYIEWAGITAGQTQSMFDFNAHAGEIIATTFVSDQQLPILAYTAKFGNGFSATVSAEDGTLRRTGDTQNLAPTATKAAIISYNGARVPDLVGRLRVDQAWGSAQIMGAYHDITVANANLSAAVPTKTHGTGYALGAGVKVNLPMLAAGDFFYLQGELTKGTTQYTNGSNLGPNIASIYSHSNTVGVPVNDGYVNIDGSLALTKTWSATATLQHFWTPQVRNTLFASYMAVSNPLSATQAGIAPATGTTGPANKVSPNAKVWLIGTNVIWLPVKGVEIGPEVIYTHVALSGLAANMPKAPAPIAGGDVRARFTIRAAF